MEDLVWTLDTLFRNKPAERALYEAVAALIASLGPSETRVTKTQVSFARERQFAWVWLPIRVTRTRPAGSIVLSFRLGERMDDPRIAEAVESYPGRWMHHVLITQADELDAVVTGWLAEAYAYGLRER